MTRRKQSNDHCVLSGYKWNGRTGRGAAGDRNLDCWEHRGILNGYVRVEEPRRWRAQAETTAKETTVLLVEGQVFNNNRRPIPGHALRTFSSSSRVFLARRSARRLDVLITGCPLGSRFLMQRIAARFFRFGAPASETRIATAEADKRAVAVG